MLWVLPFASVNELINFYVGHTINENRIQDHKQLRLYDFMNKFKLKKVKAVYDFRSEDPDEIDFCVGDILLVLDDSDENWWRGRQENDDNFCIGIFPKDFVVTLDPYE